MDTRRLVVTFGDPALKADLQQVTNQSKGLANSHWLFSPPHLLGCSLKSCPSVPIKKDPRGSSLIGARERT